MRKNDFIGREALIEEQRAGPARKRVIFKVDANGVDALANEPVLCDAVHPGYGFMAENAGFARRCAEHGLTFIGPSPEAIELMGDKLAGRAAAVANGVPVVPGSEASIADVVAAMREADRIGYPLLLKASAGGGGRGMRVVNEPTELESRLAADPDRWVVFPILG